MTTAPSTGQAASLNRYVVASLASVRPDGLPHVVAVWFSWDGASILLYSKPDAQKVRNLRRNPRAMVALGTAGLDRGETRLIEVVATLPEPGGILDPRFARKYRRRLTGLGLASEAFAQVYAQPIRLTPVRWLRWGGPGWRRIADPGFARA